MNKKECASFVASLAVNGKELLEEHINDYGDILLHVFVPDLVYFPLSDSIKKGSEQEIIKYCECIETMWKNGDDEVLNVVEVSVLECLTDDNDVWQIFGRHISREFKDYINDKYIPSNSNWLSINPLK